MKTFIVVARYKEDIQWVRDSGYEYQIVQKGTDMPNWGREPASYLRFIIDNYDNLEKMSKYYAFCQGHPFDHCKDFLLHLETPGDLLLMGDYVLECDRYGKPHHVGSELLDLHFASNILKLPLHDKYTFVAGGQFMVSAKVLKSKPLDFYVTAYEILRIRHSAPWEFERLIGYLFTQ
jgi:hypothetical protein